jgi:hypothetical protein
VPQQRDELTRRTIAALLWVAAFAFATGVFLSLTLLLRFVPPTPMVAVGRVTVERASKARDYLGAALFFILIAPLTIAFHRFGSAESTRLRGRTAHPAAASLLFVLPFFLAPFLFLTTEKWGWPVVLPVALAFGLPRVLIFVEHRRWMRELLRERGAHALIVAEALSWTLFRYIATGKRIAHFPTLFLEITFVLFVVAIFWCAFVLIARTATMFFDLPTSSALQRLAIAAVPLSLLPLLAILLVNSRWAVTIVMIAVVCLAVLALGRGSSADHALTARRLAMLIVIPLLIYCASYVSAAATWQAIDLFHRGESLGPASDYVRGKVPYRDVFVLHGLMQDGLLDAWLLEGFGGDEKIVLGRPAILGSFAAPALWFLGLAIFDSIPLAATLMLLGIVTFVDNERALLEIVVVTLFLRRRYVACGIAAGIALFYSFDIGLYSIAGAVLAAVVRKQWRALVLVLLGAVGGALPFVVYLASRGALGAFATTTFATIPSIIDAVWSLPFPDLVETFRNNLNLHGVSNFFLNEQFRFVLNPLILGIAIVVVVWNRRRTTHLDAALIVLVAFGLLTQRSALGRADFPHQYFSAFLIAPILLILLVMLWRAPRPLAIAGTAALLPFLIVALWLPDVVNARIEDTTHYLPRVLGAEYVDLQATETRHRINDVRYEVSRLTAPGQPIFDFSNQPALYFFCDRPNPTRFYQVPIMSPAPFQREVIAALERAKPNAVIRKSPQGFDQFDGIDNAVRAQAVAAYLDDYYTYAVTRRGIEIWRRREGTTRADVNAYVSRIRIPTSRELGTTGTRSRIVFPWMTSQTGGFGTRWRSDLTLHNPLTIPMRLRLRYIAGDTRVDRQVTLAAQRSIRWDDVVDTLFHAPESGGVVWIEYAGDRAPVARAQTFDVAHDRGGSIAEPLSLSDSAEGGTARDQLSVVGFSARHALVNVGVVNVGDAPMTVRLTVVAANGTRISRVIQQDVFEDLAWIVTDAEKELGVRLDPTTTVRITVVNGKAVAFASTIEANGDTQFLAGVPSSQK